MHKITGRQLELWVESMLIGGLLAALVLLVFELPEVPPVAPMTKGVVVQKWHQAAQSLHERELVGNKMQPVLTVYPQRWELKVIGEWGEGSCLVTKELWQRTTVGDEVDCDVGGW